MAWVYSFNLEIMKSNWLLQDSIYNKTNKIITLVRWWWKMIKLAGKTFRCFYLCSLCAFRLTAWFSLSFRKRVHHIDILSLLLDIIFKGTGVLYLYSLPILYLLSLPIYFAPIYWMALLLSSFKPTQLILLLAGIYLVPQILGSLWAVALSYKSSASIKQTICTKRSYFLLLYICFLISPNYH